jgi:OOP family OmpA-OmpF porin
MRVSKLVLPVVGLIGLSAVPLCAQAERPGAYFGGSYGRYRIDENALKKNDSLWKAFIGTQFNDWFGLEAAFVNFDRASNQNSSFETDGWSAAAVVSLPLGPNSALYAKGGEYWWSAKSNFAGVRRDDNGNDPFWGGGIRFGLSDVLSLRVEYERYKVVNVNLDSISVGLQATF